LGIATGAVAGFIALVVGLEECRADPVEVEEQIAKGNELRRQGHDQQALPFFQKAYQLLQTPRTEAQLGLCEEASGYPVEAEKHLSEALESPEHPFIAKNRSILEQDLAFVRTQIGDVIVEGGPSGATVFVNGAATGTLPLAAPIRVAAGKTGIEVRAPGYVTAKQPVHVSAGQQQRLTITLEKVAAAPAGVGAGSTTPGTGITGAITPGSGGDNPPARSGRRIAAWTTAGAAVVGLGLGIGFQVAASGKLSDFNNGCYMVPGGDKAVAAPSSSLSDGACTSMLSDWNSEKRWAITGYVAGGALAVTSAILFWSSREQAAGGGRHASLTCAPGFAALLCGGRF
jgi:hypothetical protein